MFPTVSIAVALIGIGFILRAEGPEGFRHLLDRQWVHSGPSNPFVTGTLSVVLKYVGRAFLAGGVISLIVSLVWR